MAGRLASRSPAPVGTAQASPARERGSDCRNRRASISGNSQRRVIAEHATCTSPSPFTQRSGSGTFRSTALSRIVVTATSSAPTRSAIASVS